jgi:hypothetical protein
MAAANKAVTRVFTFFFLSLIHLIFLVGITNIWSDQKAVSCICCWGRRILCSHDPQAIPGGHHTLHSSWRTFPQHIPPM